MITVQAPASKSVSHRMVMGAALAQGDSVVSRVLESKDLERTMAILRGAGAGIVRTGEGEYAISGVGGRTAARWIRCPATCTNPARPAGC